MVLPDWTINLTILSAVWIQCTNVTDGQTDRHRTTAKTALTHIASRGIKTTEIPKTVYDRDRESQSDELSAHILRRLLSRRVLKIRISKLYFVSRRGSLTITATASSGQWQETSPFKVAARRRETAKPYVKQMTPICFVSFPPSPRQRRISSTSDLSKFVHNSAVTFNRGVETKREVQERKSWTLTNGQR